MDSEKLQQIQTLLQYYQDGSFRQGSEFCWELLATDVKQPDILHLCGLFAYEEGRYPLAKEMISAALEQVDDEPDYLNNYGLALQKLDQFEDAIPYFQKAMALAPNFPDYAINYAETFYKMGQFTQGLQLLKKYLKVFPHNPEVYYAIAQLYRTARKDHRALLYYEKTLALNPNHLQALYNLAILHKESGELSLAIPLFLKALNLSPHDGILYLALGESYLRLGKLEEAQNMAEKAFRCSPNSPLTQALFHKIKKLLHFRDSHPELLPPVEGCPSVEPSLDILIFSDHAPNEAGGGKLPNQVALSLEALGGRVLFVQKKVVEAQERVPFLVWEDIFLHDPHPPTAFQQECFQKILQAFTRSSSPKYAFFFTKSPYLAGLTPLLNAMNYTVIYWQYCKTIESDPLISTPSFASSVQHVITSLPQEFPQAHSNYLILPGFVHRYFQPSHPVKIKPADMRQGEEKTFIFWGNLFSEWIDWDLIRALALKHPQWCFNFMGASAEALYAELTGVYRPHNVFYLGEKTAKILSRYADYADIAILPYTHYPLGAIPPQLYEYLSCGLPVITLPNESWHEIPNVFSAKNVAEFESLVSALPEITPPLKKVQEFLEHKTWEFKLRELFSHLAQESHEIL